MISDFTYVLSKTSILKTFDLFVSTPSYCPTIYTIVNAADDSPLTAAQLEWVTPDLDPATRTIDFYHENVLTHEGIFTFKVVGTSLGSDHAEFTFQVTAENPCRGANPNGAVRSYLGPELASFSYNLREAEEIKTWTDAMVSSSETTALCGAWSYALIMVNTSPLDVRAFSTDLGTTNNFKVSSTDEDMIGDHTITFKAWQGIYGTVASDIISHDFVVTIIDRCPTATITPSVLVDQSYVLRQPEEAYTIPTFVESLGYCPFEYIYSVTPASPDIVSTVVNFDGTIDSDATAPADREFTWANMDVAFAGDYVVTVTGGLGVDDSNNADASFTLSLIHPCNVATLTVDASFLTFSHKRGADLSNSFTIAGKVSSDIEAGVDCGPIVIEFFEDPSLAAIDAAVFTFDQSGAPTLDFVVGTTDPAKVGSYPMLMRGTYQNFPTITD